uniref:Uncharacterized protein n=1 Tax=uncultured Nocardioidaceae bacterium TaxID=253824 RepID=A0A6J4M8A9_9ACTN|nr:MAG: hypothetical protein AVDCRST_MAG46-2683 [uncultured Nocardioidaceae bacterium]
MLVLVRWDELFRDLEDEAAGLSYQERDLDIAERTRIELGRIDAAARLAAGIGRDLELRVDAMGPIRGRLQRVTARWLLVRSGAVQWVLSTDAVLGVRGLPARAVTIPESAVARHLGWGSAWRVLARDRSGVHVVRRDGSALDAVAERVGEDFVELTVLGTRELVPFAAVVAIRVAADPG